MFSNANIYNKAAAPDAQHTKMTLSQVALQVCQEIIKKTCGHPEAQEFQTIEAKGPSKCVQETILKPTATKFSLYLKLPSETDPEPFLKERYVYGTLPQEQDVSPICLHSSKNLLVLQNPKDLGYRRHEGPTFDEAHVKVALRTIAKLHALNHGSQEVHRSRAHEDRLRDVHGQVLGSVDFKVELEKLFGEALNALGPSSEFANVLNHGDLRREHVLFQYKDGVPVGCRLVNFYSAHSGPPANDVLCFIFNVTSRKERKKCFNEYLEYYFECISEALEIQWDEFYQSCGSLLPSTKLRHLYDSVQLGNKLPVDRLEALINEQVLSEEDCFTILNNKLGSSQYELKGFQVEPFAEKCGFLGDHFTLTTHVVHEGLEKQLRFFVKTVPSLPPQKEFCIESGAFFKEHRMFTKFLSLLSEYDVKILEGVVPRCYLARLKDVIVQDDLAEQGFVKGDVAFALTYEEIVLVVKTLAKFHAAFLILEERVSKEKGRAYRLIEDFHKEFQETFYNATNKTSTDAIGASQSGASASIDTFHSEDRKLDKATLVKLFHEALSKQPENVKTSKRFRNTITHGDLWVNNLLFKYQQGVAKDCRIVDFQSYRYHPPAHDVLGMVYLTTDRAFRRKHLGDVLNIYFEELSKVLADHQLYEVITRSEFEEACEFYKESVITQTVGHFQIVLLPPGVSKEFFKDQEEVKRTLFGNKYEFMKRMFALDDNFKERNRECYLDLAEYFESLHC